MTHTDSLFHSHRALDFEQGLQDLDMEIQAFRRKELMNMVEMKNNVGKLTQISAKLEAALTELEVRVTELLQCWNEIHILDVAHKQWLLHSQLFFSSRILTKNRC